MAALSAQVIGTSILVLGGFILSTVGIFSPAWVANMGLFKTCFFGTCVDNTLSAMPDYFKAVVAMEILAFLASLVCLFCVGINVLCGLLDKSHSIVALLPQVALMASIAAVAFAIVGCVIFAAKTFGPIKPDYSFFLTIIGAVLLIIGGILFKKSTNSAAVGGSV